MSLKWMAVPDIMIIWHYYIFFLFMEYSGIPVLVFKY